MGSDRIKNISENIISNAWATLKNVFFDYKNRDGSWSSIKREVYDRGDGAAALLYNVKNRTVLLIKQFRLPAYLNGHKTGFLLEVCAGIIDEKDPEKTILREIEEETGYRLPNVEKVMASYMTPGASTEIVHLYLAPYSKEFKVTDGGGLDSENEDIEVVEYAFAKALSLIKSGEIQDAKTIILLQQLALSGKMSASLPEY